jgi:SpoVK/Ycf46/Vps4 family AAA+-type ATPase
MNIHANSGKHAGAADSSQKIVAQIIKRGESGAISRNCIWLNKEDFNHLQLNLINPSVQIANRVYQVVSADWLKPGFTALSPIQYEDLKTDKAINDGNTVLVSPFHPTDENHQVLESATFKIGRPEDEKDYWEDRSDSIALDHAELSRCIYELYNNHYFKFEQGVAICFKNRMLYLKLEGGEGLKKPASHDFFNQLTKRTKLHFQTLQNSQIFIVKQQPIDNRHSFTFNVSIKPERSEKQQIIENLKYKNVPRPLLFTIENLEKQIREKIEGKLINARTTLFFDSDGIQVKVTLSDIAKGGRLQSSLVRIGENAAPYHKAFYLTPDSDLKLESSRSLVLVKGEPIKAKTVVIKLDEIRSFVNRVDRPWISAASVIKEIRKRLKEFVLSTRFDIEVEGRRYHLEIGKVTPFPKRDDYQYKNYWMIDKNTEIELTPHPVLKRTVVTDEKARQLKKIKLRVESDVNGRKNKAVEIDEEKLKSAVLYNLPAKICEGQTFYAELDTKERIRVFVESMTFLDPKNNQAQGSLLGFVDKDNIKLSFVKKDINITSEQPILALKDTAKSLEEAGLAGFTKEQIGFVEEFLKPYCPELKDDYKQLPLQPPKGVLLYGPPGTGKSSFALYLKKVFAVSDSRFSFVGADELKESLLGDTEKAIRKLFDDAIAAGKNGKPYFIVIDEADSIGGTEGLTSNYQYGFINTLKKQMDLIPKYAMVIFITNYPERFDKALIRAGRISHKVEFGLPDRKGRKEIFKHHLQTIIKNNRLADDVSIEVLAGKTNGLSGAEIKNIVQKASGFCVQRKYEKQLTSQDEEAKVCMSDLQKGCKRVLTEKGSRISGIEKLPNAASLKPKEALEKLGIVGLPETTISQLDSIVMSYRKGCGQAKKLGLTLPRGLLLYGKPGTGKSILGKSIVQMLDVPSHRCQIVDAADIYNEFKYDKHKDFNEYFSVAKKAGESEDDADQLSVVMIENIELLGSHLMSQLLSRLDGLKHLNNLFVVATSNNLDISVLGSKHHSMQQLAQPGRFPRTIKCDLPDYHQRLAILRHFTKNIRENEMLDAHVSLNSLVDLTKDMTTSQIKSIVRDAWTYSLTRSGVGETEKINMEDFRRACKLSATQTEHKSMYV